MSWGQLNNTFTSVAIVFVLKTMATLVHYTCKIFIKLTPGLLMTQSKNQTREQSRRPIAFKKTDDPHWTGLKIKHCPA